MKKTSFTLYSTPISYTNIYSSGKFITSTQVKKIKNVICVSKSAKGKNRYYAILKEGEEMSVYPLGVDYEKKIINGEEVYEAGNYVYSKSKEALCKYHKANIHNLHKSLEATINNLKKNVAPVNENYFKQQIELLTNRLIEVEMQYKTLIAKIKES